MKKKYTLTTGYIKPGKQIRDCRNCAKAEKCLDFGVPLLKEEWCDCWRHQKIVIDIEVLNSENALNKYNLNQFSSATNQQL